MEELKKLIEQWQRESDEYKKLRDIQTIDDWQWSLLNARWHRLLDCIYEARQLLKTWHDSKHHVSRIQFKPILFSTPMVQAILAGRKTQTRRIIKEANGWDINWKVMPIKEEHLDGVQRYEIRCGTQYHLPWFKAKCEVGNIFWVRETFTIIDWWEDSKAVQIMYEDAKTALKTLTDIEWKKFENWDNKSERKPSLFLFKSLSRIFLEVTDIRAERLHDITGDDVLSEGVDNGKSNKAMGVRWENMQRMAFEDLWNKINKNWNDNPFVWVITFKVVDVPKVSANNRIATIAKETFK